MNYNNKDSLNSEADMQTVNLKLVGGIIPADELLKAAKTAIQEGKETFNYGDKSYEVRFVAKEDNDVSNYRYVIENNNSTKTEILDQELHSILNAGDFSYTELSNILNYEEFLLIKQFSYGAL